MKKLVKGIFLILLILTLISTVKASPPIISYEESIPSWFEQLFKEPFDVTGGSTEVDTVTKGNYVDFKINLKFYHDCEKYKLRVYFMGPDSLSRISNEREAIYNYPHKTGDVLTANIRNIETSSIPDSYCDKRIYLGVFHYIYYNNAWHLSNSRRISDYFILKCQIHQCDEKAIGSLFCDSDGDVAQSWQFENCIITDMTIQFCIDGRCSNGACSIPCETGKIGSRFCKGNSIYQKFGLGLGDMECKFEDQLIQDCLSTQKCDGGQCVNTASCGDGICNNGETYNTCSGDCEKPWSCGDKICNSDETKENCCKDCGCQSGYTCINDVCKSSGCSAGETKTEICEDESTIITHTCVDGKLTKTNNKCPSGSNWLVIILVSLMIILFVGIGIYIINKRG